MNITQEAKKFLEIVPYLKNYLGLKRSYNLATISMPSGAKFVYRKNTADLEVIQEVWHKRYNPQGFNITDNDVVVDIGANIGSFTVLAAKSAKRVVSYEPDPENFSLLNQNKEINEIKNVTLYNQAVSNYIGSTNLLVNLTNAGASRLQKINYYDFLKPKRTVQVTKFAQLLKDNNIDYIDFLKMDCEGSEWEIIGDGACLESVGKIAMEFHEERGYSAKNLLDVMEGKGFDVDIHQAKGAFFGFLYGIKKR